MKTNTPQRTNEGAFLLVARARTKLNQAGMAKALGVTAQFLGRCEKGFVGLPAKFVLPFTKITKSKWQHFVDARAEDESAILTAEILK